MTVRVKDLIPIVVRLNTTSNLSRFDQLRAFVRKRHHRIVCQLYSATTVEQKEGSVAKWTTNETVVIVADRQQIDFQLSW